MAAGTGECFFVFAARVVLCACLAQHRYTASRCPATATPHAPPDMQLACVIWPGVMKHFCRLQSTAFTGSAVLMNKKSSKFSDLPTARTHAHKAAAAVHQGPATLVDLSYLSISHLTSHLFLICAFPPTPSPFSTSHKLILTFLLSQFLLSTTL